MHERSNSTRRFGPVSSAVVTAFAAVTAFGSSATGESLRQALSSAYTYNPRIDAARARLRAIDEDVSIANSGYRPTVDLREGIRRTIAWYRAQGWL